MNETPPPKPDNDNGNAPGGSSDSVYSGTRSAKTTFSETTTQTKETYISSTSSENAVLVTKGKVTLENPTISKTGDESSEESDFYGTNAAVLATSGSIKITGGVIETNASHANAVFAYNDGSIELSDTSIKTSGNNSGGIMVTGGGSLTANNISVETTGNSSAAIRSDRGGGDLVVKGGSFKTSGMGSPAIYSTANISVSDAILTSTSSEGVVIEGSNSVYLESVNLTDTNVTLNGNSETYKNIFIYQSMSGDAKEGTGVFTANNSSFLTNQGDTFFITNTTAKIVLSGNSFVNTDAASAFLRAQSGKWGTTGKNGGTVDLTLDGQVVEGDIVLDEISTLTLTLKNDSHYMGAINTKNIAKSISVSISEDSTFVLAGDTYLTSLDNAIENNNNIYSNGHTLYVDGEKIVINESEAPELPEVNVPTVEETTTVDDETITTSEETSSSYSPSIIIALSICGALIIGLIVFAILKLRKKNPEIQQSTINPTGNIPYDPFVTNSPNTPENQNFNPDDPYKGQQN